MTRQLLRTAACSAAIAAALAGTSARADSPRGVAEGAAAAESSVGGQPAIQSAEDLGSPARADEGPAGDGPPQRYADALIQPDAAGSARASAPDGFAQGIGREVVTFNPDETALLLAVGWQAPAAAAVDGFADHGERLRTFVAIAAALGLDPEVGAMQANCGTPQELGVAPQVQALDELVGAQRADAAELAELVRHRDEAALVLAEIRANGTREAEGEAAADTIAALEAEIAAVDQRTAAAEAALAARQEQIAALEAGIRAVVAAALPAADPAGAWPIADLDVTDDGTVDGEDLIAALEQVAEERSARPAVTE